MRLRERSIIFDGVDLAEEYGLYYSKFSEELPQRKIVMVSIPYGLDIDITDRLGSAGWTNGKHHLTFLLYGDTEEERLQAKDRLIASVHGRMAEYRLSWDQYVYSGRAAVSVEHKFENADAVTIDIERGPWKRAVIEERISLVDRMNRYATAAQTTEYPFDKHRRYHDIRVTAPTLVQGMWSTDSTWTTLFGRSGETDELLAEDAYFGDGYKFKLGTMGAWLMRLADNGDLIVANDYYSFTDYTNGDVEIDSPYTITDGDMLFTDEAKQYITIKYEAWDV